MKEVDISNYQVGVIIARFQIHELHEGHHYVIKQVTKNHKKTIIFLGVPKFVGTKKDPLDFDTRKRMIQTHYPDCIISPIPDQSDNNRCASELDKRIREIYPHGDVLLYGSRDSFIPHYINGNGKFHTKELEPFGTFAGTDIRKIISEEVKNSKDFRSGIIYQTHNIYPRVLPRVDIAIMNEGKTKLLLCKKFEESGWKFIGGFVRQDDSDMESSSKRAVSRKVGKNFETGDYKYIATTKVEDWRFRGDSDKVMTTLFSCKYLWGMVSPGENIEEVKL